MSSEEDSIVLPSSYESAEHREFIRDAFRVECRRHGGSNSSYFWRVVVPILTENKARFRMPGVAHVEFNFDQFENNRKLLSHFLGIADKEKRPRRFGDGIVRVFDAFLQLKSPGFDAAFRNLGVADKVGEQLGFFLRDPSALKDRARQALNVQSVVGLYEYDEVDTHLRHSGFTRVVAFLSGASIDYLKVVDFLFNLERDTASDQRERLNLVSGFCIPGRGFSPVIMRSETYQTRHLGLLYTPGSLVEMNGGVLDELTYEVFTTDKNDKGRVIDIGNEAGTMLLNKALDVHYGPRLRRHLRAITNSKDISRVSYKLDKILVRML